MARNLQSKLPASDTLRIYDINSKILDQFVSESKSGAAVQVAETVRDAAENSVRLSTLFSTLPLSSYPVTIANCLLLPTPIK
jgi:3-hydroxyisobutyrate dehydrogenase